MLSFSGNQIAAMMGAVQAFTDPVFARTLVDKTMRSAASRARLVGGRCSDWGGGKRRDATAWLSGGAEDPVWG